MAMRVLVLVTWVSLAIVAGVTPAWGHPVPDVPIWGSFEEDGSVRLEVLIDPRSFTDDPEGEPHLFKRTFDLMDKGERKELTKAAQKYMEDTVAFYFEPAGKVTPQFEFVFTGEAWKPLSDSEDPVMLSGVWTTKLPKGAQGYRIEALPEGELSVVFKNKLGGKVVERWQTLFPGEKSFVLDLTEFLKKN
ncbi:MAG: hypothetical protein AAF591_08925 [Verrucomicrobiota bacterium]